VGKGPFGVAISPDGKRVIVVNTKSRTVSVLPTDLSSLQATTFPVEKGPVGIQAAPDNRSVVVANEQSNSLSIVEIM
jgi:DNA-binding beta-propeller fold protein YncE